MNSDTICSLCKNGDCERIGYADCLLNFYALVLTDENLTNAERRFQCYKHWTRVHHGVLGKGNRIPIPKCVKSEIETWFPRDNGDDGVGFKKS